MENLNQIFWKKLDKLVAESEIFIDRPKGEAHPKYPDFIYPVDYGYLKNTTSTDGGEIDVWQGSLENKQIVGIICTVDPLKRDSEVKILYECSKQEIQIIHKTHNIQMGGILILRK